MKSYPRNEGSEKLFCPYLLKRAFNATGLDSRPLCATLSTRFSGLSSISLSYSLAEHPLPFVAGSKIHQQALHSIFPYCVLSPVYSVHTWLLPPFFHLNQQVLRPSLQRMCGTDNSGGGKPESKYVSQTSPTVGPTTPLS